MSDPERMDLILESLREYWVAHPDLRLGQILSNMAAIEPSVDVFYLGDNALELRLHWSGMEDTLTPPAKEPRCRDAASRAACASTGCSVCSSVPAKEFPEGMA